MGIVGNKRWDGNDILIILNRKEYMKLTTLLIVFLATFIIFIIIFILGRLKIKTKYLATIIGIAILLITLIAFSINDSSNFLLSLVFGILISIFCGVVSYFSIELGKRFKH
jgi:hypothetical protein